MYWLQNFLIDSPVFHLLVLTNRKKKLQAFKQKIIYWNEFIRNGQDNELQAPSGAPEDVAAIMVSGGTTGTPKGVMLTNNNFNCMHVQAYEVSGLPYPYKDAVREKVIALVPIFHGFGWGVCVHGMICYGVASYLIPVFNLEKCVKLIFKEKINYILGVPALFEVLSRSTQIETEDLSFIRVLVSGGDKLPYELQERINAYMRRNNSSVILREAYGQTECVCACCISPYF